jgi:hypothetical protein
MHDSQFYPDAGSRLLTNLTRYVSWPRRAVMGPSNVMLMR